MQNNTRLSLCIILLALIASGCNKPESSGPPARRQIATAYFHFDTGGDALLATPARTHALRVRIEYGDVRIEKTVAECTKMSGGNALGGGTVRELEVALCEGDQNNAGQYWLISEPGEISVRKGALSGRQTTVAIHKLPTANLRATSKERDSKVPTH